MKLSNRLQMIADLVDTNSIVADIGTDHGFIPAFLIENETSKYVIATDISQGSLNKAIDFIDEMQFAHKIVARLGNGLEVIKPFEVDTVIIAGMGGLLIRDILDKDKSLTRTFTNFIFQPMIASKELRQYLVQNNFKIIDEQLLYEDGKYYEIIKAKIGKDFIEKEIYYEISKRLIDERHPLIKEFIKFKIDCTQKIVDELKLTTSEKGQVKYDKLIGLVEEYKAVLSEIES